MVFSKSRWH